MFRSRQVFYMFFLILKWIRKFWYAQVIYSNTYSDNKFWCQMQLVITSQVTSSKSFVFKQTEINNFVKAALRS